MRSGSPDAQNSSSADSNASPASTRDWFSSSTRKFGSTPASNGCAFSSRWQKPWMVEIQAPSSSRARSWRPSSPSRRRIRPRSSPAARSVYVIASTESIGSPRSQIARDEALDEHRRLAGPCPRRDEDEARRVDRGQLLGVRCSRVLDHGHDLATRHIDDRSHQVGHGKPPFGSCWMSPARMRSTKPDGMLLRALRLRPELLLVEVVAAC